MKFTKTTTLAFALLSTLAFSNTYAAKISDKMTFTAAIDYSLDQVKNSPYKTLHVKTTSGSFEGELVAKTKEVVILKTKTNSIHMKTGKEKVLMTYINISTITAISAYVLDK